MSTVRHRPTGTFFVSEHGQLVPKDSFGKTQTRTEHQDIVDSILSDLPKRLPPNLSHKERKSFLQVLKEQLQSNEFAQVLQDENVIKSIRELLEATQKIKDKVTEDTLSTASFIQSLGVSLAKTAISNYFPIAGLALSALPLVAATASTTTTGAPFMAAPINWTIHEGIPAGGADLCTSVLVYGCLQGYLTKGTEQWSIGDPQFNRIINEIHGNDSPLDSTYTTLRDCLSTEVVGDVSRKVLATSTGEAATITCTATSSQWGNYTVTGQASGLSKNDCIAYQNTFNAAVLNCQNAWARAGRTAAIVGGVIGGLCLCACIIGGIVYCYKNNDRNCECKLPCA